MDDSQEGILLIATTMTVLVAFTLTVFAVMIIYQKRKVQYLQQIANLQEQFEKERLQIHVEVKTQIMEYIGSEIHDNVNQKLSIAKILSQQVVVANEQSQSKIQLLAATIDQSLVDLRNLSSTLDSTGFQRMDILGLMQLECDRIKVSDCKVVFTSNVDSLHFPESTKLFIFRIFQEFIQNTVRHSKCTAIEVWVVENASHSVDICVKDNGVGFDPSISKMGSGIRSMKKRANFIGAKFTLESAIGEGTVMKLLLPPPLTELRYES